MKVKKMIETKEDPRLNVRFDQMFKKSWSLAYISFIHHSVTTLHTFSHDIRLYIRLHISFILHFFTFTVFWGLVVFSGTFLVLAYLGSLGVSRSWGASVLKKKVAAKAMATKKAIIAKYFGLIGILSVKDGSSTAFTLLLTSSFSYFTIEGCF